MHSMAPQALQASLDGLTQGSLDRKEAVQTRGISHCVPSWTLGSGQQQGTLPVLTRKVSSPGHPNMVGRPEERVHGGLPIPHQPWEMNGPSASHPATTMALAWRHLCPDPLMAASEAALHTSGSPDHPACPKCPPGWKGIPGSPPPATGPGWAGAGPTQWDCVSRLTAPTTASGPTGHIEGPLTVRP